MLGTRPLVHQFPGAVPALLVWAKGESERLPDLAASFSAEAATLLHALALAGDARDAQRVRQAARHLYGILGKLGVPQLCTAATTLEYLGRTTTWDPRHRWSKNSVPSSTASAPISHRSRGCATSIGSSASPPLSARPK